MSRSLRHPPTRREFAPAETHEMLVWDKSSFNVPPKSQFDR